MSDGGRGPEAEPAGAGSGPEPGDPAVTGPGPADKTGATAGPIQKELRPIHDDISCDGCGRTILKGERIERYLAPGGQRRVLCELCVPRAEREGWVRESGAAGDASPGGRRAAPGRRRSLLARLGFGRRWEEAGPEPSIGRGPPGSAAEEPRPSGAAAGDGSARRRREARHVRAVPADAEVKIERGLKLFNRSEHPRTIAGIARTLGEPRVSTLESPAAGNEVLVTVAWDLSWYQYGIDLADADESVQLRLKGHELDELPEAARQWNARARHDGQIEVDRHGAEGADG